MRQSQINMGRLLAQLKTPSLPSRLTVAAPSQKTRLSTHQTLQVAPTSTVRMEYSKLRISNSPGHQGRIINLNSSQMQSILIFPQIRRSLRNNKKHKRAHKATSRSGSKLRIGVRVRPQIHLHLGVPDNGENRKGADVCDLPGI